MDVVIPYSYPYLTFDYWGKLKPEPILDQLGYYPSKSERIPTGMGFLAMSKGERGKRRKKKVEGRGRRKVRREGGEKKERKGKRR